MRKLCIYLLSVAYLFLFAGCQAETKPETVYSITKPYIYEVKQEDEIDSSLSSWECYTIPQDVLEKMSTQALIETACGHPYFYSMVTMDSSSELPKAKAFIENYDVAAELKKREDKEVCLSPYLEKLKTGTSRWNGSCMQQLCDFVLDNSTK